MPPTIEPVIVETLRLHHLHHRPIEIQIGPDHTVILVTPPDGPASIIRHEPPRGANVVYTEMRRFIGPARMIATYVNNTIAHPTIQTIATADQNAITNPERHGEFTAHLVIATRHSSPPYYAVRPDGTPVQFDQAYQYSAPGRYITPSMQPASPVTLEFFKLYAVFEDEPDAQQIPDVQLKLEDVAHITAANYISADARTWPGYQWPDQTMEALRQKLAPHYSPNDPRNPLHTALAALPPPCRFISNNPPNAPPQTAGQLTNELSSFFSETQMHFMNYYLRERSTRSISFPTPPPEHLPIIGFVSAQVRELDDSITHYYTKPLMDPCEAAPHRPPFRQVASILLNFTIHHRTPDRNEPISVSSPIYLDQSGDYQTVLITKDEHLSQKMMALFLEQLHLQSDDNLSAYDYVNTTPAQWRRQYIAESLKVGELQATENLIRQISVITQIVTKGVQPHHQTFAYEANSESASTKIQHRTH